MIPGKRTMDALRDDQDWRQSGNPPRDLWPIYKVVRDPESYRMVSRRGMVKILKRNGIADPCPVDENTWREENPEGAADYDRRLARKGFL